MFVALWNSIVDIMQYQLTGFWPYVGVSFCVYIICVNAINILSDNAVIRDFKNPSRHHGIEESTVAAFVVPVVGSILPFVGVCVAVGLIVTCGIYLARGPIRALGRVISDTLIYDADKHKKAEEKE